LRKTAASFATHREQTQRGKVAGKRPRPAPRAARGSPSRGRCAKVCSSGLPADNMGPLAMIAKARRHVAAKLNSC
jgi:hypothetical protein